MNSADDPTRTGSKRPAKGGLKPATLESARKHSDRLWLICNACQRSYLVMHDEFVSFHQLDPSTTFLLINKRLRCVRCGKKKGQCRSETHGSENQKAYPIVGSPVEGPQPARRILQPPNEPRSAVWPEISDDEQIGF